MCMLYPINLKLDRKPCLVVGGGQVAERKIQALLDAQAMVTVISPVLTPALVNLYTDGKIKWEQRAYSVADAKGYCLVISATDHDEINQSVARDCQDLNILLNVVDDPDKCNFFVPAVVNQGSLCISISTEGKSPMLAGRIREQLEQQFGPEYAEFIDLLGELRPRVMHQVDDIKQRREIFAEIVTSDILDLLRKERKDEVKERIENVLNNRRH